MELTLPTAEAADSVRVISRAPEWHDIVGEIVASCRRRAGADALWQGPGAVVVTHGAGPIGWVHDEQDAADLLQVLESAPAVNDVYVAVGLDPVAKALTAAGWCYEEASDHLVLEHAAIPVGEHHAELLGPADLDELRELLRRNGVPDSLLASYYPDDFFEVCAPVRVLGIREDGRLVGCVAVRRQLRAALAFALNIDPVARGRGLGRALVAAAAEHAAALGAQYIHAQSCDSSSDFLLSCGFRRVATSALMRRA